QSYEEEAFLREYCHQHHIDIYIKRLDLSDIVADGNSIQQEARQRRYEWFGDIIAQLRADVLLTAHHLDDQLETIIYRLFTGRSTRNSLGMTYESYFNQYKVYRPMLNLKKTEILAYQYANQIPYYEDMSNQDRKYVRNDIRQRIIPAINENPHLNAHQLLKLKDWHDIELQSLKEQAETFINNEVSKSKYLTYSFSRTAFNELNVNIKSVVMDLLFEKLDCHLAMPQHAYDEWFEQIRNDKSQFNIHVTDEWIIQIAYDKLIIMAKSEMDQYILDRICIRKPGTYEFNDYQIDIHPDLPQQLYPLTVRVRQNGDVYKLNGQKGHKKVSRLFIDKKVTLAERQRIPLIINQENAVLAIGDLYVKENFKEFILISNNGDEL
ncbi:MAG: tRNA lysidine(34) synthetase TilS, partial [Staphylococcus sp.]|nr:tRNA lysidine(34) synthetase TilS [Staphylococcus sp.]